MQPTSEIFPLSTQKVSLNLEQFSRFRRQLVYKAADGKLFYGVYEKPIFTPSQDDFYHTVQMGEEFRLDLISYFYYRTPELWWLVALSNNIGSVLDDINVGDILLIPSPSSVTDFIFGL
jgi:hypothetical protein